VAVLNFTVDAKLLRELGERLVGRPHIALAELIKNAYDADARHVELIFAANSILIVDDGHGMDRQTFTDRWMRIGTTAKVDQRLSPALARPLTGSKGVGRLAVQLLARSLDLRSVALADPASGPLEALNTPGAALKDEISASIGWPEALQKKDLTDVTVTFRESAPTSTFAQGSPHGTAIFLTELTDQWTADAFENLAREIWALQPPFDVEPDDQKAFKVRFTTPYPDLQKSFDNQMTALLNIASARVKGKLISASDVLPDDVRRFSLPISSNASDGDASDATSPALSKIEPPHGEASTAKGVRFLDVTVNLVGSPLSRYVIEIPNCQIHELEFEIRFFDLVHRQPKGIKVETAREYLREFGGVHLYDNDFRLPYYGPEVDWLRLELDHARRLSRSKLVPESLQVRDAMQDLPTNNRVFGAVHISTSVEQREAESGRRRPSDALAIQITRDRLVDNAAFRQMVSAVRVAIDLYALDRARTRARRELRRRGGLRPDSTGALKTAAQIVEQVRGQLDDDAYRSLKDSIDTAAEDTSAIKREARTYASLLGALATAGMTSLAYEHEISKQRAQVQGVARRLRRLAREAPPGLTEPIEQQAEMLTEWSHRAERIRGLFRPLLDEESRTSVGEYRARKLIQDVVEQMAVLARDTRVEFSAVPDDLRLPSGGYAAWSAVVQNLLSNAFRATLESKPPRVSIDGGSDSRLGWIRVQDNGAGLNLGDSDRLFLPFERGTEPSAKSEALGLGGSGLGLTIVRMIGDELGCVIKFVEPSDHWSTAVRVEWKETNE